MEFETQKITGTEETQKEHDIDKDKNLEMQMVGTLTSLKMRIEKIINSIKNPQEMMKRTGHTEEALDTLFAQELHKETTSLRSAEFKDYFNQQQKDALMLANKLIGDSFYSISRKQTKIGMERDIQQTEKLMEIMNNLESARTIISLVFELQPRKTHDDFGMKP